MTTLRRKDRAIPEAQAKALLSMAEYGILSTVSVDGQPYGVPLNFCIGENSIYFHCASVYKTDFQSHLPHFVLTLCLL